MDKLCEGVGALLSSLEEQMGLDRRREPRSWVPRSLGITVFQTYVEALELKSGIWSVSESVERHFLKSKIALLRPATSHSGWQFFMSGAGDITNPHIDPPLTRSIFWQLVGCKLWCIWPATTENLTVFEQSVAGERTWEWGMDNLSESGRKLLIMTPGTWWEVKQSEIHACISLTPSVHAAQEFFYVDDAEEILRVWKATSESRQDDTEIPISEAPAPVSDWLPDIFDKPEAEMDPMVKKAIDLYSYAREMVISGKSDQVTAVSEVFHMLPLVRVWIEKHALTLTTEM